MRFRPSMETVFVSRPTAGCHGLRHFRPVIFSALILFVLTKIDPACKEVENTTSVLAAIVLTISSVFIYLLIPPPWGSLVQLLLAWPLLKKFYDISWGRAAGHAGVFWLSQIALALMLGH